jgi:hypothetical protein
MSINDNHSQLLVVVDVAIIDKGGRGDGFNVQDTLKVSYKNYRIGNYFIKCVSPTHPPLLFKMILRGLQAIYLSKVRDRYT